MTTWRSAVMGAQVAMTQALDLSPVPPVGMQGFQARILWALGRHDALREADDCLRKAPAWPICRLHRVFSLAETGRLDEARDEAARLRRMMPSIDLNYVTHFLSPEATALNVRRLAAARAAGFPEQEASR